MSSAYIVIGLAYGDEGKGSWVDHLVRKHGITQVVRFNGGVQANHNVVTSDGRTHGFAQFGAATFVPGVDTLLSRFMLIEPEALLAEAAELEGDGIENPLNRILVSENAPVITPFNRLLNRILEIHRGRGKHGSCGMGIGLTQQDVEELGDRAFYARDFQCTDAPQKLAELLRMKLAVARRLEQTETKPLIDSLEDIDLEYYLELYRHFATRARIVSDEEISERIRSRSSVFEGAQGVLLDQQYGFFPHCTRSNCTFENAERLLDEAGFAGTKTRIGLLRGYSTRHGAGPLVTEDPGLQLPPCHNHFNEWQGQFRLGWFDAVSARYALEVVDGVDVLGITNLDRMSVLRSIKVASRYQNWDQRYFSDAWNLRVIRADITTLGPRCEALQRAEPVYEVLPGFGNSDDALHRYLDDLSCELEHEVSAFSRSIDHHKEYR